MLTDLLMAAEHDESAAAWLAALRGAQGPEGNGTSAVLCEPALQLALGRVVGESAEVQHFGALSQESTYVAACVERASQNVRVSLWVRLRGARLLHQRAQAASKGHSLLERAAGRRRSQGLKVEGQAACDFAGRANLLDFETSADR